MRYWRRFGVLSALFLTAFAASGVVAFLESTRGQWALLHDVQKYFRCLPYDYYTVTDLGGGFTPRRGDLVRFVAPERAEHLTERFEIVKIVAGIAGDRWAVRDDHLFVNDELWAPLYLLSTLGAEPGSFDREGIIPEGHVLVLGTNPSSYDSRYWGPLHVDRITGKAHVLL